MKRFPAIALLLASSFASAGDFVDLRERQNDKIESFSGGMKRRVNIAVGLLHQPQLLFMDEPTVGIDPQNRRRVLDMVLRLRDEMHITILYTSHLMEEVQEISDRVAIMDHGEVIALGTVGLVATLGGTFVGGAMTTWLGLGNALWAFGFLQVLRQSGVRVTEEVSVVGFDDLRLAQLPGVELTTLRQDPDAMAEAAVEAAARRLEDAGAAPVRILIPAPLVVRRTTGPARR